jgi:poly(3-hydroxybutyrate) depolymerase
MPSLTDAWINVIDPVLKPSGAHIISRHYKVWDGRANCAPGQTAKLVVALHGALGSADGMAASFAPQGPYVVVYPSGSNKGLFGQIKVSGNNLFWNPSTPTPFGWAEENGVNDDMFIAAVVAKVKNDYGLTTAFAVGHSQGGLLTYHLACEKTLFAAIATVATTHAHTPCAAPNHVPNIHVHGLSDGMMCWDTTSDAAPWPPCRPGVEAWQASGTGHKLHLVENGEHAMDSLGVAEKVWPFFDAR